MARKATTKTAPESKLYPAKLKVKALGKLVRRDDITSAKTLSDAVKLGQTIILAQHFDGNIPQARGHEYCALLPHLHPTFPGNLDFLDVARIVLKPRQHTITCYSVYTDVTYVAKGSDLAEPDTSAWAIRAYGIVEGAEA